MKVKLQDLQILARTECMILWDKLSQNKYDYNCPFCDGLRNSEDFLDECKNCIWPGEIGECRCLYDNSPFAIWFDKTERSRSFKKDRIKYAKEVFTLIENTEITNSDEMIEI
jgi:hypothetical protein